jgi:6-phosphogluconolactonase
MQINNKISTYLHTFDKESLFIKIALEEIKKVCKSKKYPKIALSGGSTPKKIYSEIAKKIPLKNIIFYQVDEKYVPKKHTDSNYWLIKKTILSNPKNQPKAFHYFDTSLPIKKSLKKYSIELPKTPFDLVILGIGNDGHIASLFPNSPALKVKKSQVANTKTRKFKVYNRLTLTYPPILNAKKILVLLKNKPDVVNELINGKKNMTSFPAKVISGHNKLSILHLDFEAK